MIRAAIYDGSPCDHPSRLGAGSACFPSLDYESLGGKQTFAALWTNGSNGQEMTGGRAAMIGRNCM